MITEERKLILVDEKDREIGVADKMEVHRKGLLHRAFSLFIINDQLEVLIQRRALQKYHSAGLWSNACCGHPSPGESLEAAAHRRLQEELGINCTLKHLYSFLYNVSLDHNLIEHEWDHVFMGQYNGAIYINKDEVMDIRFVSISLLKTMIMNKPGMFTPWFRITLFDYFKHMKKIFPQIEF